MTEVPKGLRETRKMAQETKVGRRWQRMPRKEDRNQKKARKKKNKGLGVEKTGVEAAGDPGAARSLAPEG